jgi:hypothetical protein
MVIKTLSPAIVGSHGALVERAVIADARRRQRRRTKVMAAVGLAIGAAAVALLASHPWKTSPGTSSVAHGRETPGTNVTVHVRRGTGRAMAWKIVPKVFATARITRATLEERTGPLELRMVRRHHPTMAETGSGKIWSDEIDIHFPGAVGEARVGAFVSTLRQLEGVVAVRSRVGA